MEREPAGVGEVVHLSEGPGEGRMAQKPSCSCTHMHTLKEMVVPKIYLSSSWTLCKQPYWESDPWSQPKGTVLYSWRSTGDQRELGNSTGRPPLPTPSSIAALQ